MAPHGAAQPMGQPWEWRLPCRCCAISFIRTVTVGSGISPDLLTPAGDRKSTRLNSSHLVISYAVFCLKKKKKTNTKAVLITFGSPTNRQLVSLAWSTSAYEVLL